jgi:hypothetical protein
MPTLDRTEIVNLMLASTGEPETTSGEVATPTQPEVKLAVRILDQVDREVQLKGLSFSRDLNVTLTPVAGEITLPAGVIAVEAIDGYHALAILNGKLYDRYENTYTFSGSVRVNTITQRSFTYLPMHALMYIQARATRKFFETYLGEVNQMLRDDEKRAEHAFFDVELELAGYSMANAPDTSRAFARRPPLDHPHHA